MRIAVTGQYGQVAASLADRGTGVEVVLLGRPALDLLDRNRVLAAIRHARPDVVISAAAYTAVDKAEDEPDLAMRINGDGAGHVAEAASSLGVPLLHLSTDYVFDGALDRPYREDDETGPTGAYGRSKLVGESRVLAACPNSVVLRTAWVYSPFGTNFVRTMLRLGETREAVGVVADQLGNPTSALDIANALLTITRRVHADPSPELRGIFHMTGGGEATWADFAEAIFVGAQHHGRMPVRVTRIATADYPTAAKRPANSRLNNAKLRETFGIALPDWQASLSACLYRLLP